MWKTRVVGFTVVGGILGISVFSGGCSSGSTIIETLADAGPTSHHDGGSVTCTPNAQQCATTKIAETCNAEGNAWVPTPCAAGQTCTSGVCGGTAPTGCTPGAKQCLGTNIAEVCPADGAAWVAVACATGQTCSAGVCGGDGGTTACMPNATQCVSPSLARVCPADGSGWLAVECAAGQVCANGACTLQLDAPCTPGQGSCTTSTTGFLCNTAGTNLDPVTCPANTTCVGGNCMGAVQVGSSQCTSLTSIATSPDGFTYTQSNCPTGTYCVTTGASTAACLAGNCTPDVTGGGCNSVCGNEIDSTANQAEYMSTCTATPTGYQWVAIQCAPPGQCDPQGSECGSYYSPTPAPGCVVECTPGNTQCAPDGSGVQTCATNGTWGTPAPCNVLDGLVCQTAPSGQGACGTPVCFVGPGTCTSTGLFQACNTNLVLEPASSAAACPSGESCVTTQGGAPGAIQPGVCTATCYPGSQSCINGGISTCTSAGAWGPPTACTGSNSCQQYTSPSTLESVAVCGVCVPGTHQCSPLSVDGGEPADIETCGDNAQWGTAAACQVGACASTGTDFACLAECTGTQTCGGLNGTQIATCSATGVTSGFKNCTTAGDSCRVDSNGDTLGCIQCLGPDHGLPADQLCTTSAAGVPGTTDVDTCGADDKWSAPVACTSGETCSNFAEITACETFGDLGYSQSQLPAPLTVNTPVTNGNLAPFGGCGALSDPIYGIYSVPETCGSTSACCSVACGLVEGVACEVPGGSGTGSSASGGTPSSSFSSSVITGSTGGSPSST